MLNVAAIMDVNEYKNVRKPKDHSVITIHSLCGACIIHMDFITGKTDSK